MGPDGELERRALNVDARLSQLKSTGWSSIRAFLPYELHAAVLAIITRTLIDPGWLPASAYGGLAAAVSANAARIVLVAKRRHRDD